MPKTIIIDPDFFHYNTTAELKTGLQKISAACQIWQTAPVCKNNRKGNHSVVLH